MNKPFLVVGAGFSGLTVARVLADAGHRVTVLEKRDHIGGNAYDVRNTLGLLVHPYGPHIFHTNSEKVLKFLDRFTYWRPYTHIVKAKREGQLFDFPINANTLSTLLKQEFTIEMAEEFLNRARLPSTVQPGEHRSSEDLLHSSIGSLLTDLFYRDYSKRQWGLDLSQLSASVAARIPVRADRNPNYFSDTYQCMPDKGYTAMFKRMAHHKNISVCLGTRAPSLPNIDFDQWRHVVYTGPLDAAFDYAGGVLPYRSIHFVHYVRPVSRPTYRYQDAVTVNYVDDNDLPFPGATRNTEFTELVGDEDLVQRVGYSALVTEHPCDQGEPYYPVPTAESQRIHDSYREFVENSPNTTFVGRLAQYRYYNMDQAVAAGLHTAQDLLERFDPT